MWKHGLYLLAFLAIASTASGCGRFDNLQAHLNEEFSLSIGQRGFIVEENLEVRFEEVIEDSRCPTGVICIWAGMVSCVIELVTRGSAYHMVLTEFGLTDEYATEKYKGYELAFHITPYPEAGKQIDKDNYRLHLIIGKAP